MQWGRTDRTKRPSCGRCDRTAGLRTRGLRRTGAPRPPGRGRGRATYHHTARAEAPAQEGRAAAIDVEAIIERDRQQAEAAHQAKTADGKSPQSPQSPTTKSPTTKSGHLKGRFSGGKTETTPTATPQTADEKSITAADDDDYTDEMYRADEKACFELMDKAARARGASQCSTCGCPRPGDRLPAVWREVRRGLTRATPLHAV